MLLQLIRTEQGLIPTTDKAVAAVKKIKVGTDVFVEYKPRRNYKFHKKYYALLNAVILNQEHYKTVENLHEAIKFYAGYYETIIPLNGDSFIKTKSIAFHAMEADEFDDYYNVALDECLKLVGDDALNEILKFL